MARPSTCSGADPGRARAVGTTERHYVELVRVIGGTARGRRLRPPRSGAVRPTTDRVREAIFDILGALGVVEGAAVCDLFAGSGALGIEALSRGAESVTFVESDREVVEDLRSNLTLTGFDVHGGTRVVRGDAAGFLAGSARHFDIVLADPPYRFDGWVDLLGLVRTDIAVLESRQAVELPEQLELYREYRYGTTLVTVARAVGPAQGPPVSNHGPARGPGGAAEDDS